MAWAVLRGGVTSPSDGRRRIVDLVAAVLTAVAGAWTIAGRPDVWWIFSADTHYYETLASSIARHGVGDNSLAGGLAIAYHWFSFAWVGIVADVIGAAPWVALTRIGPVAAAWFTAAVVIDLLPGVTITDQVHGRPGLPRQMAAVLAHWLPRRLATAWVERSGYQRSPGQSSRAELDALVAEWLERQVPNSVFGVLLIDEYSGAIELGGGPRVPTDLANAIEATVAAMCRMGASADRIVAAIGPAIGRVSYEVGPEFPGPFLAQDKGNSAFFFPSPTEGRFLFDLKGYAAEIGRAHV